MDEIQVVPYDPAWPAQYEAERERLHHAVGAAFVEVEHVGSTAVPGLQAKPIIDIMAAVPDIEETGDLVARLTELSFALIDAGMPQRLFLRRPGSPTVHLHVVGHDSWPTRKERLMRDHLRAHPEDARRYGALKDGLALGYRHDGLGYTRAKTALIQEIMDRAWAERGLPSVNVWEE